MKKHTFFSQSVYCVWLTVSKHEDCSESNASYFIMWAHDIRGVGGGTAVEVELIFCSCCSHVPDGNRGAV